MLLYGQGCIHPTHSSTAVGAHIPCLFFHHCGCMHPACSTVAVCAHTPPPPPSTHTRRWAHAPQVLLRGYGHSHLAWVHVPHSCFSSLASPSRTTCGWQSPPLPAREGKGRQDRDRRPPPFKSRGGSGAGPTRRPRGRAVPLINMKAAAAAANG